MRLLNTNTLRFVEYVNPEPVKYAILSHTWDPQGEQNFQELSEIQRAHVHEPITQSPRLSPKIREFCRFARDAGYELVWIDSCCIDKTSSAELSETINSMFAWYRLARVCYAFLADVGSDPAAPGWEQEFRSSRWHRRGWTLQELVSPRKVKFLSRTWEVIGT